MIRFEARTAIVIGGGAGIGCASAQRLAQEGAAVVIVDVRAGLADEVADHICRAGGRAIGLDGDARRRDDVTAAVSAAQHEFGGLDVIHHNVGVGYLGLLEAMTDEEIRDQIDLNIVSTINALAVGAPALRAAGGGAIVVTSSVVARWGCSFQVLYSAGKGAVEAMIRAAAMEFSPDVRVNGVAPGLVQKDEADRARNLGDAQAAAIQQGMAVAVAAFPIPRPGREAEIAAAVAFLASDEAAYVTGEVLTVGGGWTRGQTVRAEQIGL